MLQRSLWTIENRDLSNELCPGEQEPRSPLCMRVAGNWINLCQRLPHMPINVRNFEKLCKLKQYTGSSCSTMYSVLVVRCAALRHTHRNILNKFGARPRLEQPVVTVHDFDQYDKSNILQLASLNRTLFINVHWKSAKPLSHADALTI
jgi:hypothetical protein